MPEISLNFDNMDNLKETIQEEILDNMELDDIELDFSKFEFKFDYSIDVKINSITLENKQQVRKPL